MVYLETDTTRLKMVYAEKLSLMKVSYKQNFISNEVIIVPQLKLILP